MSIVADPLTGTIENHRQIMWLSAQYYIRMLDVAKAVHNGDVLEAIIFTAIWSANVAQVRMRGDYRDGLVPDELRRPVTVARLAQIIGMPTETVRRHVVRMVESGLCIRVGRKGVVTPSEVFLREPFLKATEKHCGSVRQFYRALTPLVGP